MDRQAEPVGSEGLSPPPRRDGATEIDVIDDIMRALPRMARAERRIRRAFITGCGDIPSTMMRERAAPVRSRGE